jgi:sugar lactone lactonase YvrE
MQTLSAEVVFPILCDLGEGALWDAEHARLYWLDIVGHKVFSFDPRNRSNLAYDVGESVGTVVVTRNDKLLLALRSGIACLDPATGGISRIADPESDLPGNRFNDGKCDPEGRFWVGTMVEKGPPGGASLYCLNTELVVTKKLGGVTISNGLVWTRDRRFFYYIDTPTHEIWGFDFDPAAGEIKNRRAVAEIPRDLGAPDGMTIDEEDHLWVALWGGSSVVRVSPLTGQIDFRITLPAQNVTSCAFGGRELDELYITTARVGLDPERRPAQPLAGSLFRAKVPVRGVPSRRFGRDL